ncbi:2-oxoglutarate dehydrogenase complex dihydrolipoyllysine-residue succinyltransferase [Aureispira anguillae]|uniref:Dihydrolipoyllysine-residue succinyltransferase component of 2-oxoglutarate dehydrogenase complex n=1 Tax=Aureispira anguillae TaxID=2864201 RepID=A0A915YL66_9BACT|nr:2-oxoglutarate dehydrogenase complex dihydrolipoyllysine-residue succinyltransferase [Aureispira anguillae]BDS14977.1 2-oxoglutarate dehydrogenase complex dihydrolipoyllysine-residue succinyltransferase [Aureispira anguillae]
MSIIELVVPVIGESITEVTLSSWIKEDGAYVELDEIICEFESDKATVEVPAEKAGKLIWVAQEGDDIPIGEVFAKIDTSVSGGGSDSSSETTPEVVSSTPVTETPTTESTTSDSYASGHPSPTAQKLMNEHNLKADAIVATGKDGRITQDDVQKAIDNQSKAPAKPAPTAPKKVEKEAAPVAAPIAAFSREKRTEKMSRMRRTIAKRLVSAKNNTAMLTTFNEVDLTEIMALRKKYQDKFVERYGIKLGFMSLFSKACAKVLMEMPAVNAQIGEDGKSIIYHDYVDISIAISTPTGLVVPPVKNVESLNFAEIEGSIKGLAKKAREGSLTLQEMQGGTFTITNGGVFGSMMSTPIINEPQSAILGMHTIQQRPMAIDGEVKIRPMMYLALSYDHRIIDGSSSVTFLVKVKQLLEDPVTLLLDL